MLLLSIPGISCKLLGGTDKGEGKRALNTGSGRCPDLTGTWHSPEYRVRQVITTLADDADLTVRTERESAPTNMTLTLKNVRKLSWASDYDGRCIVIGENIWTRSGVTTTEKIAGILIPHDDTYVRLTLIEFPLENMSNITTAGEINLIYRQRTDETDAHIVFRYSSSRSTSESSALGLAFSTILTKSGASLELPSCPNILGVWRSGTYDVLQIKQDDTLTLDNLNMTLNVTQLSQRGDGGCVFVAKNMWTYGTNTNVEDVVGVIHKYEEDQSRSIITMSEMPEIPNDGKIQTTGRIRAGFHAGSGDGQSPAFIGFDYAALGGPDNDPHVNVFTTTLVKESGQDAITVDNDLRSCPDITGVWTSPSYKSVVIGPTDNTSTVLSPVNMSLIIRTFPGHKSSCVFLAEYRWTFAGKTHREKMAGVLHRDDDESHVEFTLVELRDPGKSVESAALVTAADIRVKYCKSCKVKKIHFDYIAEASNGMLQPRVVTFTTVLTTAASEAKGSRNVGLGLGVGVGVGGLALFFVSIWFVASSSSGAPASPKA